MAPPPTLPECPTDVVVPIAGTCNPDPCVIRTGQVDGYTTTNYGIGHQPGADNGTTANHAVDCHVTRTPTTLPNTGSGQTIAALAFLLCTVGAGLVAVGRRKEGAG